MVDAWSNVRPGAIRKFCFMQVDLAAHSEIARNNPTEHAGETFTNFLDYAEGHVEAKGGRTWHLAGDGGLFVFCDDSQTTMAQQAVASALAIVDHLDEFNVVRSRVKQRVHVRIAVHLGDATYTKQTGRIQSDDINFVAHLEHKKTVPDAVSISESVYRELMGATQERFRDNGTFEGRSIFTTASIPVATPTSTRQTPIKTKEGLDRAIPRSKKKWLISISLAVLLGVVLIAYWLWKPRVDVRVMKRSLGSSYELRQGEALTASDRYEIFFTPSETLYVYVYQVDTKDGLTHLFPRSAKMQRSNPVPAGTKVRIPHDPTKALGLQGPVGKEKIIVGASRQEVQAAEVQAAKAIRTGEVVPRHALDIILEQMDYVYTLEFQHIVKDLEKER